MTPLAGQDSWSKYDFLSSAEDLTVALLPGPLPTGRFAQLSFTFMPVFATAARLKHNYPHPVIAAQWWVSPNLAISSVIGASAWDEQLVRSSRFGFEYHPEPIMGGLYQPKFILARGMVNGLDAYKLRWNELRAIVSREVLTLELSAGLVMAYQTVIADYDYRQAGVRRRMEPTFRSVMVACGYSVLPWLQISAALLISPSSVSGNFQAGFAL